MKYLENFLIIQVKEIYESVSFQSFVSTYRSVSFQTSVKLVMEIYGSVSEAGESGLILFMPFFLGNKQRVNGEESVSAM